MDSPLVLAIDDSHTNRIILRDFLESGGAGVILAEDGAQGTALAIEHHPDVIVLDVVLPDADGIDLCRRWREDPALMDIPVLLISGERLADEDRAAGLRSGALGYLLKPFTDVELLAQVSLLHQLGKTHKQLKTRNAELEASNQQLEEFAYVVSHDLKEPLRTIAGYCMLLARHCNDEFDAKANELMQVVVDGTARMQELIDDLLTYSRVGRTRRPLEAIDTAELLKWVIAGLEVAINEGGATVEMGLLPSVQGNRMMLGQLFQNLLENAIKFRSEEPPVVQVFAEQVGRMWRITVADNGIGIEPRQFERIFGVFEQLHTRDRYPGTGIGLALCKKIVDHHGGRLWLESEPGQGTKFHVELKPSEEDTTETLRARGTEANES